MYPQRPAEDGLIARLVHIAVLQHLRRDGGPAHPPGQGGGGAVGLHVHKVAPPADELADEQAVDPQVGVGQKAELLFPAEDQQYDGRGDDGPVDSQAAVPVVDDAAPVQGAVRPPVHIQVEHHIVHPDGHQGGRDGKEHHVDDVVLADSEPFAPAAAQIYRQNQAAGDDNPIPVDRPVQNREGKGHPVQDKLQPQDGEGYRFDHVSSLARTTDRAVRSSVTQFSISSCVSSRVTESYICAKSRKS